MRKITYFLLALSFISLLHGQNISILGEKSPPSYKVGLAKTDITAYQKGAAMLGYSMAFNTSEGVKMKLSCTYFCDRGRAKSQNCGCGVRIGIYYPRIKNCRS